MRPRVVAIDGAAGSGKSTLARSLAGVLGLAYINTGWMYRAVAAAALEEGVGPDDEAGLASISREVRFTFAGDPPALEVEGWTEAALTSPEVERSVSAVARHPAVREVLRRIQRRLGEGGAVMEGRDIGAVVFPDAPVKVFLQAQAGTRVTRRAAERDLDPGAVAEAVSDRDARDARTNPLEPVADAVVLDTEGLGIDATLEAALDLVRERAPELMP
ncbi:MAG: (d)CMP kinase [Actinomycetota bacterium]